MEWRLASGRAPRAVRAAWLAAALAGFAAPALASAGRQADTTAAGVVRAFYAYHMAHNAGFTASAVRRRARWLTPQLLEACRAYFAKPRPNDEVPPIDGDPFTDSQDIPTSFSVGAASLSADTARVGVTFSWPDGPHAVTVILARPRGAWRIADVRYESGPSFTALLASGE